MAKENYNNSEKGEILEELEEVKEDEGNFRIEKIEEERKEFL